MQWVASLLPLSRFCLGFWQFDCNRVGIGCEFFLFGVCWDPWICRFISFITFGKFFPSCNLCVHFSSSETSIGYILVQLIYFIISWAPFNFLLSFFFLPRFDNFSCLQICWVFSFAYSVLLLNLYSEIFNYCIFQLYSLFL